MKPEIKLQKYVFTRILSGFYKAFGVLWIFKVREAGYTERKWSRNFTVLGDIARIFIEIENFYCPVIFFTVTIYKIYLFAPEYFF